LVINGGDDTYHFLLSNSHIKNFFHYRELNSRSWQDPCTNPRLFSNEKVSVAPGKAITWPSKNPPVAGGNIAR
jgi:hypothetical protein